MKPTSARKEAKNLFLLQINAALASANLDSLQSDIWFDLASEADIKIASGYWQSRLVNWRWTHLFANAKKRTREVVVSIKSKAGCNLIGLCVLRVTKGRLMTKLVYLERDPLEMSSKLLVAVMPLLVIVAKIVDSYYIAIDRPHKKLVGEYQRFGFDVAATSGRAKTDVLLMVKINLP